VLERIRNEPAVLAGAVVAVLNALVLLDLVSLSAEQVGGINVALAAVLGLFVRASVTPTRTLDERGAVDVVLMLLVAVLLGVVLLLFGVTFK